MINTLAYLTTGLIFTGVLGSYMYESIINLAPVQELIVPSKFYGVDWVQEFKRAKVFEEVCVSKKILALIPQTYNEFMVSTIHGIDYNFYNLNKYKRIMIYITNYQMILDIYYLDIKINEIYYQLVNNEFKTNILSGIAVEFIKQNMEAINERFLLYDEFNCLLKSQYSKNGEITAFEFFRYLHFSQCAPEIYIRLTTLITLWNLANHGDYTLFIHDNNFEEALDVIIDFIYIVIESGFDHQP